jgi:hypothetical protein
VLLQRDEKEESLKKRDAGKKGAKTKKKWKRAEGTNESGYRIQLFN